MKFDLYTKALLTIIALCLIWICVKDANFVSSAHANTSREPAAAVASTVVAPNEVVSFQLAWNERTDAGIFNYRVRNEVRDRTIRVRTLSDLAGWAALVSQKPLNIDNRGWIYTGREPVREQ